MIAIPRTLKPAGNRLGTARLAFLGALLGSACLGKGGEADSGDAGDAGDAGDTGDTGDTGDSGDAGDGGDTGDAGDAGDTGDSGDWEPFALLVLNLHCFKVDGTSYATNGERFAAVAALAADEDVAALAVQEACVNDTHGTAIDRLAEALADATGQAWGAAWAETHVAWEGTDDEATEGVGLLVRGADPADVEPLTYAEQGLLTRLSLTGTLPDTMGGLRLTTVHLEYDDLEARLYQARQTAMHALVTSGEDLGALVAGDFNATAGEEPVADLLAAGFARLSEDADPSFEEIDHVFAPRGSGIQATEARLVFDGTAEPAVSDHPGVLVHLAPATREPATLTRLVAEADAGWGSYLAVRGDTAPLSWESGWPGIATADSTWEVAFASWESGTITYKWLRDDEEWESGADHEAAAGSEDVVSPDL